MISVNRITGYNYYPYTDFEQYQKKDSVDMNQNTDINKDEIVTTWQFDEEGNIVYYTYNVKTGKIISKIKYKNPNKLNL